MLTDRPTTSESSQVHLTALSTSAMIGFAANLTTTTRLLVTSRQPSSLAIRRRSTAGVRELDFDYPWRTIHPSTARQTGRISRRRSPPSKSLCSTSDREHEAIEDRCPPRGAEPVITPTKSTATVRPSDLAPARRAESRDHAAIGNGGARSAYVWANRSVIASPHTHKQHCACVVR